MPFDLLIVTPSGESYRGPVDGIVLPGSEGEFGVLPSHERFLAPLAIGEVRIRKGAETVFGAVAGGFAEVRGDQVAVLVESCELAGEIDLARAELARSRAEQGLARLDRDEDAERYEEFEAALRRAQNRITVGGHG